MDRASISVSLGDGASALFWPMHGCTDARSEMLPRTSSGRCQDGSTTGLSVKDALTDKHGVRDIMGPLTTEVLCDYVQVWELLESVHLDKAVSDRFVWKWSADGRYSASSAYRAFFIGLTSLWGAKGTLAVRSATVNQAILLACPTRATLDFWPTSQASSSRQRRVRPLRSVLRDQ